jgi:hypothetical protein
VAVMNDGIFWDIVQCSPYVNRLAELIFYPEDGGDTFF